ncbi:MAG: hypothetical protein NZ580_06450 [Bacteroidia bacterium]|nr:hypothetical protein [Bacteroidia bacterium]MDW8235424.1 hypothetical protein [Bacteroidia bacterium]
MACIRRFSLFLGILQAQALPDSIWFLSHGGDTLSLTVLQLKGNCWGTTLYLRRPAGWHPIRYDTFCVDERQRLTLHLRYDSTGSGLLSRVRGAYPSPREAIFTQDQYESPQGGWIPGIRLHLWGISQRWDSMLSGWYGIWFLGANSIQGNALWCHPLMTSIPQWGDSLLYEEFFPSVSVFVERGGYVKVVRSQIGCDTILSYEGLRLNPSIQGSHTLCKDAISQLIAAHESLRIDTIRVSINRNLSYTAQRQVEGEFFTIRRYTLAGQLLSTSTYTLRYNWDSNSRLTKAHYVTGVYYLRYGRTQIVGLPDITPSSSWDFSKSRIRIYTLLGSYLGEVIDSSDIPPDLAPGLYLLEESGTVRKVFLSP